MTPPPQPATILQSFVRSLTDDDIRRTFAMVDRQEGTTDGEEFDGLYAEAATYFDRVAPADRLLTIEVAVANGLRHCRAPMPEVCPAGLRRLVGPGRTRPHFVLSNVETLRRVEERLRRALRAGYHEANFAASESWRDVGGEEDSR